jgi:hypothetical protein
MKMKIRKFYENIDFEEFDWEEELEIDIGDKVIPKKIPFDIWVDDDYYQQHVGLFLGDRLIKLSGRNPKDMISYRKGKQSNGYYHLGVSNTKNPIMYIKEIIDGRYFKASGGFEYYIFDLNQFKKDDNVGVDGGRTQIHWSRGGLVYPE